MGSASSSAPLIADREVASWYWYSRSTPAKTVPSTFRFGLSQKILCEAKIRME